jgi:hypothetical protein
MALTWRLPFWMRLLLRLPRAAGLILTRQTISSEASTALKSMVQCVSARANED